MHLLTSSRWNAKCLFCAQAILDYDILHGKLPIVHPNLPCPVSPPFQICQVDEIVSNKREHFKSVITWLLGRVRWPNCVQIDLILAFNSQALLSYEAVNSISKCFFRLIASQWTRCNFGCGTSLTLKFLVTLFITCYYVCNAKNASPNRLNGNFTIASMWTGFQIFYAVALEGSERHVAIF